MLQRCGFLAGLGQGCGGLEDMVSESQGKYWPV